MREINVSEIENAVRDLCIQANRILHERYSLHHLIDLMLVYLLDYLVSLLEHKF